MVVKYRSKISVGLLILFIAIFGITAHTMMNDLDWLSAFLWLGVIISIPISIFWTAYYEIDEKNGRLRVKGGWLFSVIIPIDDITKIVETSSILSAPAFSMDRIEVYYNKYDSIVVSPKQKQDFVQAIQKLNNKVVFVAKKR